MVLTLPFMCLTKIKNMEKPIINEVFVDNGEHSHWELIDIDDGKLLWSEDIEESNSIRVGNKEEITEEIPEELIRILNKYEPSEELIHEICHSLPCYITMNIVNRVLYNINTCLEEGIDGDTILYEKSINSKKVMRKGTVKGYTNYQVLHTYEYGFEVLSAESAQHKKIIKNKKWKYG